MTVGIPTNGGESMKNKIFRVSIAQYCKPITVFAKDEDDARNKATEDHVLQVIKQMKNKWPKLRKAWCICWTSVLYGCKLLTIFGKKAFQSWLQADCRDRPLFRHHSGKPLSAYLLRSMGMQTASPDYP